MRDQLSVQQEYLSRDESLAAIQTISSFQLRLFHAQLKRHPGKGVPVSNHVSTGVSALLLLVSGKRSRDQLTDRASTIPSNIRGSQSGTWSAGQKTIRGIFTKLQREQNKNTNKQKRQRERNKNNKIHMPEKDRRRALDRESYDASTRQDDKIILKQHELATVPTSLRDRGGGFVA